MAENEKCSHTLDGRSLGGAWLLELTVDQVCRKWLECCGCGQSETINANCIRADWLPRLGRQSRTDLSPHRLLSSNCNLNLDTRLNVNNYLLHNLRRCVETRFITTISNCLPMPENPRPPISLPQGRNLLNQTLVNAHLICIPSLTPLTTGSLPRGDLQALSGETDWTLDAEIFALRTLNELLADLFEALNFARCQGDADLVDFL